MSPRRDAAYLEDILIASRRAIERLGDASPETLRDDLNVQDGVIRSFTIIGEAANHVSAATKSQLPSLDWSGMVGLRNVIVHRYREIQYDEIWRTVRQELPPVVAAIERFLSQFP